jgi:ABC-type transport system involved in multi-copper enzyme maturation permease subunit
MKSFWIRIFEQNPVVLKEMRSAMRGGRAYIIITVYLTLMGALVGLVYAIFASSNDVASTSTINQTIGKSVFATVVGMQLMMVTLLSPALTAGAIATERERQTYDLLRTTLLPARSLVQGKLTNAVLFLILLLAGGFPLLSLSFFFGGVSLEEVLVAFLLLSISAVVYSAIGIFVTSFMKTTLLSTVVSYVITLLLIFGTPVLLALLAASVGMVTGGVYNLTQYQQLFLEIVGFSIGYALVAVNPASAAVASEIILVSQQSLFYTTLPLTNGWKYPVISPWIICVIFYIVLSLILVRLSTHMVARIEK